MMGLIFLTIPVFQILFVGIWSLERDRNIRCVLIPDRKYLSRPHGINNQILLYYTMFTDLKRLINDYKCVLYIVKCRAFISHLEITNFYLPFERIFEGSEYLITTQEYNAFVKSAGDSIHNVRTSYKELVSGGIPEILNERKVDELEGIVISFDTANIYDNSIWRWFYYGFLRRDPEMIDFFDKAVNLGSFYHRIFEHMMSNNNIGIDLHQLQEDTLVVHLRFAPHCLSTAAKFGYGEWFEGFVVCDPTKRQFVHNIDEILYVRERSHIQRIVFLTINETQGTVEYLMDYYSDYDPVVGSSFFDDETLQEMALPQYVRDVLEYMILENSYAHLSTFISTYSLVGSLRRGFRRSYFFRPFGFLFGRLGGFFFLGKVIFGGVWMWYACKLVVWMIKRDKEELEVRKKKKKKKIRVGKPEQQVWVTGFYWVCIILIAVFFLPILLEVFVGGCVALYYFKVGWLLRDLFSVIWMS